MDANLDLKFGYGLRMQSHSLYLLFFKTERLPQPGMLLPEGESVMHELIIPRSVAARAFYRSQWPEFLYSDSVLNRGVRKDVLWLTKLMGLLGIITGIAGIVTPLGLYQALLPDQQIQVTFKYLADNSPFGYGTPPRSNLSFGRQCSHGSGLLGKSFHNVYHPNVLQLIFGSLQYTLSLCRSTRRGNCQLLSK